MYLINSTFTFDFYLINYLFSIFLGLNLVYSIYIFFMKNNVSNSSNFGGEFGSGGNINPQNDMKDIFIAFISTIGIISISYIVSLSIDYFSIKSTYNLVTQTASNNLLCETLIELLLIEKNYYNFSSDTTLKPHVIFLFKQLENLPLTITFNDLIYIFNEVQTKLDYIAKITLPSSSSDISGFSLDTKQLYFESKNGNLPFKKQTSIALETQEEYLHRLNLAIKALKIKYKI